MSTAQRHSGFLHSVQTRSLFYSRSHAARREPLPTNFATLAQAAFSLIRTTKTRPPLNAARRSSSRREPVRSQARTLIQAHVREQAGSLRRAMLKLNLNAAELELGIASEAVTALKIGAHRNDNVVRIAMETNVFGLTNVVTSWPSQHVQRQVTPP